jgi:hypothetical protein
MENQNENSISSESPISDGELHIPRKSTGPRTAQGKRRSSQNSLKHGLYANGFSIDAAIALGEDPREFERLLKGLMLARQPADVLETVLVEDIALLIWNKARLDRAEAAVQARNLQKHDLERRKLSIQAGVEISDISVNQARETGLRTKLDAPGKFEQVLSLLHGLIYMVEKNDFSFNMQESWRVLYGSEPTLRGDSIFFHYRKLATMKPSDPEFETVKNLLTAKLAEEIADVGREYDLFLREHFENTRLARVAATAPSRAQWAAIIRQQNALQRQLERKIRLLQDIQEKRLRRADLVSRSAALPNPPDGPTGSQQGGSGMTDLPGRSADFRHVAQGKAADLEQQVCASSGPCQKAPGPERVGCATALRGGRPACARQKTLNRGNELNDLLKTQGLASTAPSKRTVFCAPNMLIKAQKGTFRCRTSRTRCPNSSITPRAVGRRLAVPAFLPHARGQGKPCPYIHQVSGGALAKRIATSPRIVQLPLSTD